MKPLKSLLQFATWLMRLAIVSFAFVSFLHALKTFDIKTIQFYIAVAFILFSVLLFIGGFMSKPAITVFSGIMLFFASVYEIVILFSEGINIDISIYAVIASTSFYFVTAGNKH